MAGTIDDFSSGLDAIPNTDVDADSPLDTTFLTEIRDQIEFIQRWVGKSGIDNAIADHANAGVLVDGTSPIVGASGGAAIALQTTIAEQQSFTRINFLPEVSFTWPTNAAGGHVRHSSIVATLVKSMASVGHVANILTEEIHGGMIIASAYADSALKEILFLKSIPGILDIGTYAGDGTTSNPITGVGFNPEAGYIAPTTNHATNPLIKTVSFVEGGQGTGESRGATGTLTTSDILTFDADGFTVGNGTGVNNASQTYFYVMFKTGVSAGERVAVVTFTGDGTDNRNLSGSDFTPALDFTPDVVFGVNATAAAARRPQIKTRAFGLGTKPLDGTALNANVIQKIIIDGIQVGTDVSINENTETIDLICLKGGTFRW